MAIESDILNQVTALLGRRDASIIEWTNWMAGSPTGGPNQDGRYPLTNASGQTTLVPCPASAVAATAVHGPLAFGAIGDGKSHPASQFFGTLADCQKVYPFASSLSQEMDWLGWQKMINTPGTYTSPKKEYVMCNGDPASHEPLSWCAGITDVDAGYSRQNWSALRFKTTNVHAMPNYNFATSDGWFNTSDYDNRPGWIIYANFNKGYAECIDDKAEIGARNPYYEFKHPVSLPPGRYRMTMKAMATRGISFHYKNGNPPYCTVHFQGVTDRSTTVFPILDPKDPENIEVPVTGTFDFQVTSTSSGNVVFKGGGYVNLRVLYIDIVPFIPNCAILNHRDGAPGVSIDHYFLSRRLRNCNFQGPYNDADNAGLSCGVWKSFNSIDGSLQDWDGIKIFGFDMPFNWQDGAYLINYFACDVESRGKGCYFGPGSVNAGENIKFYWGSVSGGKCAFTNPGGAEFSLFGTIVDYNEQLCAENSGKIRLLGTRHEQHIPTDPTKPIWHCTTGRVMYDNSYVLLAGGVNESPCPPAKLDTHQATIEFHNTEVYNLSSASGTAMNGAGRIHFYGFLNNGNPNLGPDLISANASSDILGGAGLFEPPGQGNSTFFNTAKNDINFDGGLMANDPAGVMIDRWNSTFTKITVSTDFARTGTRSLRIEKLKGIDNTVYNQLQIIMPILPSSNILGVVYHLFPFDVNDAYAHQLYPPNEFGDGSFPVYFRQFYVRVIGRDSIGRPILSSKSAFKGEEDLYPGWVGKPDTWIRRKLATTYGQPTQEGENSERAPAWATHYMLAWDFQMMPANVFYIDGLQVNCLG